MGVDVKKTVSKEDCLCWIVSFRRRDSLRVPGAICRLVF